MTFYFSMGRLRDAFRTLDWEEVNMELSDISVIL